jgi:hypothetical protein
MWDKATKEPKINVDVDVNLNSRPIEVESQNQDKNVNYPSTYCKPTYTLYIVVLDFFDIEYRI